MEKFSVKKPFTILVAVIMVLLLGFVSITNLQTNLLPDISTPYLMVVTVYPGASPERVESEVSDVMENALGTVSGVESITATSAENYSLLLMKFAEGTDMNSAMVKTSNKVDQTASSLPGTCLTPSIIEYSLNMNAFMTVAVSREGSDVYDLSDFVDNTLVPYVGRTGGVSSVSANGLIEKMVQVQLNQDKIDEVNARLLELIDTQLADARAQLDDAEAQIAAGRAEYEKQLKNFGDTVSDTVMAQMGTEVADAVTVVRDQAQALLSSINQLIGVVNEPEIQQALIDVRDGLQRVVDQFNQTGMRDIDSLIEIVGELRDITDKLTAALQELQGRLGTSDGTVSDLADELEVSNSLSTIYKTLDEVIKAMDNVPGLMNQFSVALGSYSSQQLSAYMQFTEAREKLKDYENQLEDAKQLYEETKEKALASADVAKQLDIKTLAQLIYAQNFSMPAGYVADKSGESWLLKVGEEYDSVSDIEGALLLHVDGFGDVRLSDVADVAVIDNADALGLDNPNGRQYESKYFDLVDAGDGNVWVKADRQLVIYWPYPDGIIYETAGSYDFDVFHFTGLHREYTTNGEVQAMVNQAAANINNEKGGAASNKTLSLQVEKVVLTEHGIQLIVDQDRYGFSPFVLSWAKKDTGGGDHGGTTYYTLRYESNGGTKYKDERYRRNTLEELDKEPVREGYTFTGWYADKALTEPIDDIRMTSNKTVYAGWERTGVPDRLNGDDHFAYIIGRDDGLVHPEATITRAEVATIFFRLLTDEARDEYLTETSPFADVASDAWYATAVATMQAMGIVEGRAPAVFDPDAPITRGEFAAIAARFDSAPYDGADRFTDIGGHWAAEYINQAAVKGWVEGQPDGSFAPDRSISRAEAMTLVNRVLGRLPETADDLLDGMITWPDNPPGAWYYLAVQEATNSHDYGRKADTVHETWTGLQPVEDWTRYEQ